MRRSRHDGKTLSLYDSSYEVKQYGDQIFGVKMEDKMTTTKKLNSIAVNTIFARVLNTDPAQEAQVAHEKILFKRGYKISGEREIAIMFK